MKLDTLISKLREDMSREYAHWHFYMEAAMNVRGLHREELSEFFLEAAAGEMKHIKEFGNLLIGLGSPISGTVAPYVSGVTCPKALLKAALEMEEDVVKRYVARMDEACDLQDNGAIDKIHGRFIEIFLENQILDSRTDADNIREMIK